MTGGVTRSVLLALVVAGLAAPPALPGTSTGTKSQRSGPTRLWRSFPLGQPAQRVSRTTPTSPTMRGPLLAPAASQASGSSRFGLLAIVAAATFVGGGLAVLLVGLLLRSAVVPRGLRIGRYSTARLPLRPTEGGSSMSDLRRKLWARAQRNASRKQSPEQPAGEGGMSRSTVERLFAYSTGATEPALPGDAVDGPGGRVAREGADAPEAEESADDLAFLGDEVGTVLQSAREAAVAIRRTAREEAERLRVEATSAAAAELDEADRIAEADRADGQRNRAEAEADAERVRAGAEASAENRRKEAEDEAAQILGDAHRRLAAVDAQVAQKVRGEEAKAGQRRQALHADAQRHEERLESILVVVRGMTSQLEELLGGRRSDSEVTAGTTEDAFREALLPNRSGS
jgi:vacuolar-type H+-ATPase subunit E/Vma4